MKHPNSAFNFFTLPEISMSGTCAPVWTLIYFPINFTSHKTSDTSEPSRKSDISANMQGPFHLTASPHEPGGGKTGIFHDKSDGKRMWEEEEADRKKNKNNLRFKILTKHIT